MACDLHFDTAAVKPKRTVQLVHKTLEGSVKCISLEKLTRLGVE